MNINKLINEINKSGYIYIELREKIIKALREDNKYENMWGALKKEENLRYHRFSNSYLPEPSILMKDIEQKYLYKEVNNERL